MQPTSRLTRALDNIETELLIQSFSDRVLVLITQVGKVGNLIQAAIPPTAPLLPPADALSDADNPEAAPDSTQSLPAPPPSIQLTPLLGSAPTDHSQTLHPLYASQAATLIWLSEEGHGGQRKPVVVGIALKAGAWDETKAQRTFIGVMQMLKELLGSEPR